MEQWNTDTATTRSAFHACKNRVEGCLKIDAACTQSAVSYGYRFIAASEHACLCAVV